MENNFIEQGYHPSLISEHLERISLLNRIDLIMEKATRKNQTEYLLELHITNFYQILAKTLVKIVTSYR